jgi:hypothetical protein
MTAIEYARLATDNETDGVELSEAHAVPSSINLTDDHINNDLKPSTTMVVPVDPNDSVDSQFLASEENATQHNCYGFMFLFFLFASTAYGLFIWHSVVDWNAHNYLRRQRNLDTCFAYPVSFCVDSMSCPGVSPPSCACMEDKGCRHLAREMNPKCFNSNCFANAEYFYNDKYRYMSNDDNNVRMYSIANCIRFPCGNMTSIDQETYENFVSTSGLYLSMFHSYKAECFDPTCMAAIQEHFEDVKIVENQSETGRNAAILSTILMFFYVLFPVSAFVWKVCTNT